MQENSTLSRIIKSFFCLLAVFFLNLTFSKIYAQQFCSDEVVYYLENFGTGTEPSSHPDVLTTGLTYQAAGSLASEGTYRVINNTQQKPEWHNTSDHTPGDTDGKMLVINGQSESFFNHVINNPLGFTAGYYSSSLYILNVNTPGTCSPNPLLPLINFRVDYQDAGNNWMPLVNSPISSGSVPQTTTPTWVLLGAVFTLPATGNFVVTNIRIRLADGIVGGCGNDFALDDIKLASCPSGGSLPVSFLNVSARQKGSGVNVNWATASEMNNDYFQVERSNDAGVNWNIVANVKSAGNGNLTKNYAVYDPKPVIGINYYRIKQVDLDGRFKYSVTVTVKLTTDNTGITVLANPFNTNITVDLLVNRDQVVSCRLIDVMGKQLFSKQVRISKGANRQEFGSFGNLSSGIYVLQITADNGEVLYNGKLIKQ